VTILQATWESTLLANWFGLYNGGTAGVIWCTIAVWILMLCLIMSLAEMASMAPTAGGESLIHSLMRRADSPQDNITGHVILRPHVSSLLTGPGLRVRSSILPEAVVLRRWLDVCSRLGLRCPSLCRAAGWHGARHGPTGSS
jgi:hypothetical protein